MSTRLRRLTFDGLVSNQGGCKGHFMSWKPEKSVVKEGLILTEFE